MARTPCPLAKYHDWDESMTMTRAPSSNDAPLRSGRARRSGLLLAACMGLATAGSALVSVQTQARAATPAAGPVVPVSQLYDALRRSEAPSASATAQRMQALAPVVDQAFDLHIILRNSVGMRFETLSPADQTRLLSAFRQYTIARYASTFKPGTNARFSIAPMVRVSPVGNGNIVDTKIGGSQDDGTAVDYITQSQPDGTYKIVDILLNAHISQVAANRADFSSALSRGGVDALIDLLNRKTQSLMNG